MSFAEGVKSYFGEYTLLVLSLVYHGTCPINCPDERGAWPHLSISIYSHDYSVPYNIISTMTVLILARCQHFREKIYESSRAILHRNWFKIITPLYTFLKYV